MLDTIHRKLFINRGQLSEDIVNLDELFHKVKIFMEKEEDCTLIVYGDCFPGSYTNLSIVLINIMSSA